MIFRKWIFICCCGVIFIQAKAQQFNQRFDFFGGADGALSIVEIDNGYVTAGWVRDTLNKLSIGIIQMDINGNEVNRKTYHPLDYQAYWPGSAGAFIKGIDDNYYMCGSVGDTTPAPGDVYIYKFDQQLELVWFKRIVNPNGIQIGYFIKQTPDKGFIITGRHEDLSGNSDALLIKTDSLGNEEWTKHYGGNLTEIAFTVDLTHDGGYILGGYTKSYGNGDFDTYLIKTDNQGNMLWQKTFGGIYADWPGFVSQLSSGGFIVATSSGNFEQDNQIHYKIRILKLTNDGEVVWDKQYGNNRPGAGSWDVVELADGTIIVAGQNTDPSGTTSLLGYPEGVLLKITSEGDSLWWRVVEYFTSYNSQNYLRKITLTQDGGIAGCGFINPGYLDTGGQDFWVFKTDSWGCLEEDCHLTSTEEMMGAANTSLTNYPNPFTGSTTVVVNSPHKGTLKVYDILGREVLQTPTFEGLFKVEINDHQLQQGTYYYSLIINNAVVLTQKMIKL
jgi:hypothetical protein